MQTARKEFALIATGLQILTPMRESLIPGPFAWNAIARVNAIRTLGPSKFHFNSVKIPLVKLLTGTLHVFSVTGTWPVFPMSPKPGLNAYRVMWSMGKKRSMIPI